MSQPAVIDVPNLPLSTIELPKTKDQTQHNSNQQQAFSKNAISVSERTREKKCSSTAFLIACLTFFKDNGDIIVTLLPVNEQFPWITPATFRPELVPEELMAQNLTVCIYCATYVYCRI